MFKLQTFVVYDEILHYLQINRQRDKAMSDRKLAFKRKLHGDTN